MADTGPTVHERISRSCVDINLCAGAGGLALGLKQAGFDYSNLFDLDPVACATLAQNIRDDHPTLHGRIFEGDLSGIEWTWRSDNVRLLAAGAPCQPFSMGGSRRGAADERNLFPTILSAVRALRPRAVLIENVRGLERGLHRPYLEYILRQLRHADIQPKLDESWEDHDQRLRRHDADESRRPTYHVAWCVLNAADFGVPQVRYRVFIVATATGLPAYEFPNPTHSKRQLLWEQATGAYWEERGLIVPPETGQIIPAHEPEDSLLPWVTVRDAIEDLSPPAVEERESSNNHWIIQGARAYSGHTGSVMDWPSKTLKAGVHGVPGGENMVRCDDRTIRYYTLREMARIQTFPDRYRFIGARSNVTRQIGNAVPCNLAAAVAKPLRAIFRDESSVLTTNERASLAFSGTGRRSTGRL